jgi:hypothetical protein
MFKSFVARGMPNTLLESALGEPVELGKFRLQILDSSPRPSWVLAS